MKHHLAALFVATVSLSPAVLPGQSAWRVDAAPVLDLSSTGPNNKILFTRVTAATRFSDGTLAIADADDKQFTSSMVPASRFARLATKGMDRANSRRSCGLVAVVAIRCMCGT